MLRQFPKDLGIRLGLAQWRNGWPIEQHIGVAVAHVHVPVLQLCGGGQHIVGVVSAIGLEVFQHHGKQIVALKTLHHPGRVRGNRDGVAVVDDQRFDGGAEILTGGAQQVVADGAHVDRARVSTAKQVGPLQCGALDGKAA